MQIQFLGQSGFLIQIANFRVVIDPYLSDAVAEKCGSEFARQVPIATAPGKLAPVDAVLLTHSHLDHADPLTLQPLAAAAPDASFFAPHECRVLLADWGIDPRRVAPPPTQWTALAPGIEFRAVPAAHVALERDPSGECRYVGWLLRSGGVTLYHAGDTVPHAEIFENLAGESIDCALLPVNERNFFRDRAGIIGNMTVREAFRMAADLGARMLIPIHWDMFVPNRVHPAEIALLHNLDALPFSLELMNAGDVKQLDAPIATHA